MKEFLLPKPCWENNNTELITFPEQWSVNVAHMNGFRSKILSKESIYKKIIDPIKSKSLSDLAKGKKNIVILVDDLSRPTKSHQIVPFILNELKAVKIKDSNIKFIWACAAHEPGDLTDFRLKLGSDILEKYQVFNHNPFSSCDFIGKTKNGTPLYINSEVMKSDLKIGVGCIVPHPFMEFSGGGKIIMPGVASIETMEYHHGELYEYYIKKKKHSSDFVDQLNEDIIEAVNLTNFDFKIDVLVNYKGESIGIYAGNPIEERKVALPTARKIYKTKFDYKADIVIANCSTKVRLAINALPIILKSIKIGGDVILIANTQKGQLIHYLYSSFGRNSGGKLWKENQKRHDKIGRLIIQSEYKDMAGLGYFGFDKSIFYTKNWKESLKLISEKWKNYNPVVTVIPDATLQI